MKKATPKTAVEAPQARHCVTVKKLPGESDDTAMARVITQPSVQAASTIQAWDGQTEVNTLAVELSNQIAAVNAGSLERPEALLTAQAHTLDQMFNSLARSAKGNLLSGYLEAGELYLRLAFKAQGQCRATLEALGEIKNPLNGAYVRQANLAQGHQQVNNGSGVRKTEMTQSKLLETQDGKWLDTGTSQAAIPTYPRLAAMATIDRPEIDRWQDEGGAEPLQGRRASAIARGGKTVA